MVGLICRLAATTIIIKQASVVLNAERSTLFIYVSCSHRVCAWDDDTLNELDELTTADCRVYEQEKSSNMLVLKVSDGATDIHVPFGKVLPRISYMSI